ncbi:MAG: CvpA family protein [Pseudohongiellaceae bacterium]
MNWIDIAILSVLGVFCLIGIWTGLVRVVLFLCTLIVAVVVALLYRENVAAMLTMLDDNSAVRDGLAYALPFVFTTVVGLVITHLILMLLSLTGIRPIDRLLGGMFGILAGVIVLVGVLYSVPADYHDTPDWESSHLIPYGMEIADLLPKYESNTNEGIDDTSGTTI